ncbi:MAG: cation:proton antiporter, partial [Desulfobacteraceae bacterium]|nr:cation:proton antiporter [Desulfobacteraceae bacterium]
TITVTANSDGVFRVHAIDRESAVALPGKMLEKVAAVFGEEI